MDSRIIYELSRIHFNEVHWEKPLNSEPEWVHFGLGDSMKVELVVTIINQHIKTNTLFIVRSKKDSLSIKKK